MANLCYLCFTFSTLLLGAGEIGSTNLRMTRDFQTPCSETTIHMSTSTQFHGQHSFVEKSAYSSDKKRQHDRERYSLMSDEQRQLYLRKNREYKKCRQENRTFVSQNTTPDMQAQSSNHYRTGIVVLSVSFCHL